MYIIASHLGNGLLLHLHRFGHVQLPEGTADASFQPEVGEALFRRRAHDRLVCKANSINQCNHSFTMISEAMQYASKRAKVSTDLSTTTLAIN